ncbi:MAG: DNA cytosine methyltransferase [Candidatus Aminicenantes bacterium]|nr:DNA cytosine methyltransferase [Candidatus Aminicenantes bacterium]
MKRDKKKKLSSCIPVLSFFTGGGFLDIGFERAGFYPVWTNEANPAFAKLYAYGMTRWRQSVYTQAPHATISSTRSIEKLFAPQIIKQAFFEDKPGFFGIIGGPPCPDFSVGGKNKGGRGISGRLSEIFVNRIIKIKPSFFVFENVPGLYKTMSHREFLSALEQRLERHGYCLDLRILNALDLGVPQDRKRLFMIGIQKEYAWKCLGREIPEQERNWFPWPNKKKYNNARTRFNWPGIVLDGEEPILPEGLPAELTVYSVLNTENCPSKVQNGKDTFKTYSDKFSLIKEGDTKRKSFKKLHRYRFSPTACYGNNEVHLHPWHKRRLSVREAMRIQGIPDSYALPEEATLSSKFSVVSNGVPVPLAYEVANKLNHLFSQSGIIG